MSRLLYWVPGFKKAEQAAFEAGWALRGQWDERGYGEWHEVDEKYYQYFFKAISQLPIKPKPTPVEVVNE